MRSALLLIGGLVLLGAGIAVLALDVPGALVMGPGLILAGLLVKAAGFVLTDGPVRPPSGSGRTVTTLGTNGPERTRGAGATGRMNAERRARAARTERTARAQQYALEADRPGHGRRSAS
jgi:hypothetical protein